MDSMSIMGRERLWTHSRLLMLTAHFDGIIVAANPAWTSILGRSPESVVGTSFFDLIHPDDVARTVDEATAMDSDGKQVPKFANRYRHADGSYRNIDWTAVSDGEYIHALGRDDTEERSHARSLESAQEAMRQAQKVEAIGQLTGGVAHDFNNLLTVIRGSCDMLMRDDLSGERRTKYVRAISDTADRAAKLTGQLLAFARRQALKNEIFDVGKSVHEVAGMIRTLMGSRITLDVRLPREPLFAAADRSQLDTALVNMAINARDAMNDEGRMTIAVGAVSNIPSRRDHAPRDGDFVGIAITDSGQGIGPDDLDHIFEPFFTTKNVGQGTGLGLSQVFGFIKQTGGDVLVESVVGQGSTFTLYLPRAAAQQPVAVPAVTSVPQAESDQCILLVEDNAAVGEFAAEALQEIGFDSVHAIDASCALAELAANADRFHAVFTDVVMPGMNGVDLANEVRRLYPAMPVILTSGYSHVLAENGTHGFELLHKPYSIDQLSRVITKAIA